MGYPYTKVSVIGDTWQTRAHEIRVIFGVCLVRPDINPSGIIRPGNIQPSGYIHNHVPPQYHVVTLRSCNMIFFLSGKSCPLVFTSSSFVLLLLFYRFGLNYVNVGPRYVHGPRPIA